MDQETGIKKMREGIKEAANENLLTPRFYTTDFDEMERLFSTEINPNLDETEINAILNEFREDFNQKHFVRNDEFKAAADQIKGEPRRIFIEFLERSCTAEFSGFLLYKELGRRLKKTAPAVAEIFTLMSRDEARHAGVLEQGDERFQLGARPRVFDQEPPIHVFPAEVHHVRHVLERKDWLLALHLHLPPPAGEPGRPAVPVVPVL